MRDVTLNLERKESIKTEHKTRVSARAAQSIENNVRTRTRKKRKKRLGEKEIEKVKRKKELK